MFTTKVNLQKNEILNRAVSFQQVQRVKCLFVFTPDKDVKKCQKPWINKEPGHAKCIQHKSLEVFSKEVTNYLNIYCSPKYKSYYYESV